MWKFIKRWLIRFNLMAEKATESDAFNEVIAEDGIRKQKERAEQARKANGALASQGALLTEQIKRQTRERDNLMGLLQAASNSNDTVNGANFAEQLNLVETDLKENQAQADAIEESFQANTAIVADAIRQIQVMEREFQQLKAKVKVSRALEGISSMAAGAINELQGVGGEAASAMQRMREAAAVGTGQQRATVELAKSLGANAQYAVKARQEKGKLLFEEFQRKQREATAGAAPSVASPAPTGADRQRVAE